MAGEKNLRLLLQQMQPELHEGEYVFCCISKGYKPLPDNMLFCFKEKEGLTVVLTKEEAEAAGLAYDFVASWITLTVHSALHAVGLTAAFATALAAAEISCNVVAACYHDHIFVPIKDASKAMQVLQSISEQERN